MPSCLGKISYEHVLLPLLPEFLKAGNTREGLFIFESAHQLGTPSCMNDSDCKSFGVQGVWITGRAQLNVLE